MASTYTWKKDNGTQTGSPTAGTTRATATETNWKSIDDNSTAFTAAPVIAGNNSYEVWLSGEWGGTYSNIFSVLWAHTAGTIPTGTTLKGIRGIAYTTPSTAANANLTVDMSSAIAIGLGQSVNVGGTSPQAAGKAASTSANPAYTEFLTTQLQTISSATQGDSSVITETLQWNEN